MTTRILAAATGGALLCFAQSAWAFHFAPPTPPAIVATGPITLVQGSNTTTCTAKWKFHVVGGHQNIKLVGVHYSGPAPCSSLSTTGLPSTGKSPNLATFDLGVTMVSPFGTCGGFQSFGVSGGVISWSNSFTSPACTFSGSLTTSPTLSITP